MQQHPGIGLGGFRKPPTSVGAHRQMILPCRQPATDSAIIVSGCSRPECGCQDRIAGSAGGSPGSRHCPSWVPWQLGPWWRSGRELCQPQTTWSSQQEAPWPSKPVLEPVLSQTAVLSRVRHKPTRLPSLVGKMSLVATRQDFFVLSCLSLNVKNKKDICFRTRLVRRSCRACLVECNERPKARVSLREPEQKTLD